MVARKGDKLRELKHLLVPVGLPVAVVIGLALLGKDLGTVMVIGALVLGALWFGGIRMRYLVGLTAFAVAGAVLMAIISPNRVARITSFFDGSCDYEGLCWQTSHGFFALARGGLFGVGLGNSTAKWSWLPEADNDFIFAIIGEEFGLVGALAVILLFGALALVLLRIWRETRNPAGRVVIGGVLVWFIFQAFVNIAVVLGLLPVLGVPLPLLSSGGSALITSLFAIGLALSVARDNLKHDLDAAASPRRKVSAK
jgi:cell division protein FtsW